MEESTSFEAAIQLHKGLFYKVVNIYCRNDEDKKDLLQEITIQLWKAHGKYNSEYKFSTWAYRIALNVAISFYRKNSAQKNQTVPFDDTSTVTAIPEASEKEEKLLLLERFIGELKELDKALMLLYLAGKDHREIADVLGISVSNVSTKTARIKERLKMRFSTYDK